MAISDAEIRAAFEFNAAESDRVKNLHHMYFGYHILAFDPLDPTDARAKGDLPVFDMKHIKYRRTPDTRVSYPVNMTYYSDPHTEWSVNGTTIETAIDFTDSFSFSYEIGAGGAYSGFSGSFSSSASYTRLQQYTRNTQNFIEHTRCEISLYTLEWTMPKLSAKFIKTVQALPKKMETPEQEKLYMDVLSKFGTHWAKSMNYGGRGYQEFQTDTKRVGSMLEDKVNVSIAAEVALGISAKIDGQSEKAIKLAETFMSKSDSSAIDWLGGDPAASFNEWVKSVPNDPIPREISFRELPELLRGDLVQDKDIDEKRAHLEECLIKYLYGSSVKEITYSPATPDIIGNPAMVSLGSLLYCIGGSAYLHSVLGSEQQYSHVRLIDFNNLNRKDDVVKTLDEVGILISGDGSNVLVANPCEYEGKRFPGVRTVAVASSSIEEMHKYIETLREEARYQIVNPERPDQVEPVVAGRQYILRHVGSLFYLPDVNIRHSKEGKYFSDFDEIARSRFDAGRYRFLLPI